MVGPSIPSKGTLVHNLNDPVQEVRQVRPQDIRVVHELLDLDHHEDGIDFVAGDENFQPTVARRDLASDYDCTQLAEGHLEQVADLEDRFLQLYWYDIIPLKWLKRNWFVEELYWYEDPDCSGYSVDSNPDCDLRPKELQLLAYTPH